MGAIKTPVIAPAIQNTTTSQIRKIKEVPRSFLQKGCGEPGVNREK